MKRTALFIIALLVLLVLWAGIPPASASPTISSVNPVSWPNSGTVVITIKGSGFTNVDLVRLNRCKAKYGSGEAPFTGEIISRSSNEIRARFTVTGKKTGEYDVSVRAYNENIEDWGEGEALFELYEVSGSTPTATSTTGTETTTTTDTSSEDGDNSVFFDTNPTGATIYLQGDIIGTSPFTYYTDRDGTYDVIVRKTGYEEYSATVTILEGRRVHFYAPLTMLSSSDDPDTTSAAGTSGTGKKTPTPAKGRFTLALTPLKAVTTIPVEESPAGPATVLWAVASGIILLAVRRK